MDLQLYSMQTENMSAAMEIVATQAENSGFLNIVEEKKEKKKEKKKWPHEVYWHLYMCMIS